MTIIISGAINGPTKNSYHDRTTYSFFTHGKDLNTSSTTMSHLQLSARTPQNNFSII